MPARRPGSGPPPRRRAKHQHPPSTRSAVKAAVESQPFTNLVRLQKVLAAAGVASRRECEALIAEGRVTVEGQVASRPGTRVDPFSQDVRVDGEPLPRPKLVYFAVHKPPGVVSTNRDEWGRTRVTDLIPPHAGRVFTVGRLDMASEGLILLTNDGTLANRLTHPRYGIEKTYQVQVAGRPEKQVLESLEHGVRLAEGMAQAKRVRIKSHHKRSTILEMVLTEGRNREIRRMLAAQGHKVQRLRRVAIGPLRLAEMPPDAYRPLTRDEIDKLREAARQPLPEQPRRMPRKPQRKRSVPSGGGPVGSGRRSSGSKQPIGAARKRKRPVEADDEFVFRTGGSPPAAPLIGDEQAADGRNERRPAKNKTASAGKRAGRPKTARKVGGRIVARKPKGAKQGKQSGRRQGGGDRRR